MFKLLLDPVARQISNRTWQSHMVRIVLKRVSRSREVPIRYPWMWVGTIVPLGCRAIRHSSCRAIGRRSGSNLQDSLPRTYRVYEPEFSTSPAPQMRSTDALIDEASNLRSTSVRGSLLAALMSCSISIRLSAIPPTSSFFSACSPWSLTIWN